jgi:hypothetical protein
MSFGREANLRPACRAYQPCGRAAFAPGGPGNGPAREPKPQFRRTLHAAGSLVWAEAPRSRIPCSRSRTQPEPMQPEPNVGGPACGRSRAQPEPQAAGARAAEGDARGPVSQAKSDRQGPIAFRPSASPHGPATHPGLVEATRGRTARNPTDRQRP